MTTGCTYIATHHRIVTSIQQIGLTTSAGRYLLVARDAVRKSRNQSAEIYFLFVSVTRRMKESNAEVPDDLRFRGNPVKAWGQGAGFRLDPFVYVSETILLHGVYDFSSAIAKS